MTVLISNHPHSPIHMVVLVYMKTQTSLGGQHNTKHWFRVLYLTCHITFAHIKPNCTVIGLHVELLEQVRYATNYNMWG